MREQLPGLDYPRRLLLLWGEDVGTTVEFAVSYRKVDSMSLLIALPWIVKRAAARSEGWNGNESGGPVRDSRAPSLSSMNGIDREVKVARSAIFERT